MSFSPTKIRIAFECPRLFYLNHHFKSIAIFKSPNNLSGMGKIFHKIAKESLNFIKENQVFSECLDLPLQELKEEKITAKYQELLYQLYFEPISLRQAENWEIETVNILWQGISNLIPYWVKLLLINRQFYQAYKVINNTFLYQELTLKHTFKLANKTEEKITGRLDLLWFDWQKNRFCIMDYKTYKPVDISAHLAQVALYSYMLTESQKIPTDAGVFCIFPEFTEYYYRWELLTETVHKMIPAKLQQMQQWVNWKQGENNPPPVTSQLHLCDICPQKKQCYSYFL